MGSHGGVGGCTEQWPEWLQVLACWWHIQLTQSVSLIFNSIISCWTKASTDVFLVHPQLELSFLISIFSTALQSLFCEDQHRMTILSYLCHQWGLSIKVVSTMMSMYTSLPHMAYVILRTIDVTWIITSNKTVGNLVTGVFEYTRLYCNGNWYFKACGNRHIRQVWDVPLVMVWHICWCLLLIDHKNCNIDSLF